MYYRKRPSQVLCICNICYDQIELTGTKIKTWNK